MKNNNAGKCPVVCRVATAPYQFNVFLKNQILYTQKNGFDVILVTPYDASVEKFCDEHNIKYIPVEMKRRISVIYDIYSLIHMLLVFTSNRIDVVHSISSKAGFLTAISAFIARIPVRLHVFAGLPWANMSGLKRIIAKSCDRLIVKLSTRCYSDSSSQKDILINYHIADTQKVVVLGKGTVGGIDLSRFDVSSRESYASEVSISLRKKNEITLTFVGRINREKGVEELISAFKVIESEYKDVRLILVGDIDHNVEPISSATISEIKLNKNIIHVGFQERPELYLSISDIFVLPSYREGFGNVVIEASAMGVCVLGTRVTGLVDSIVENETGILVEPRSMPDLVLGLKTLIDNSVLRNNLGRGGIEWSKSFDQDYVNSLVVHEYKALGKFSDRALS